MLDRELRYVYVNPEATRQIGLSAADLIGRTASEVIPDAATSTFLATFEEALATGLPTVYQGYVPARDRWYEQRCYPYADGITVLFHDITEQKRTEKALLASEDRFRTLADAAPVLIWMSDLTKGCYYFNQPWLDFTGRPLDDLVGAKWAGDIHPDDRVGCLGIYESAFDAREPFEMEYRLRRHDGAYRWLIDRGAPQFDGAGAFTGFIGSCIDIHERWSSERQMAFLADASHLLSSTLDPEAVLAQIAALVVPTLADWCAIQTVTETGEIKHHAIVHVDPEMMALAADLNERYPPDLDAPGGLGHVVRTGESLLITDVTPEMIEAGAKSPEHLATLRTLGMTSALVVPLRTRERVIGGITLIATHGSRRYDMADVRFAEELAARAGAAGDNAALYRQAREAEAALRDLNQALEERVEARTVELARTNHELAVRNRELQDFAYVASHDLQEPLRKVQSFADLLVANHAPTLGEEGQHFVERIQAATERMSRLIKDLLAFSRVATEQRPTLRVDLNETLAAVQVDLEMRLGETGGRLEAKSLPTVVADPLQMHQLLLNLIGNALKFHRPGVPPVVRVRTEHARGTFRLVVEDNGIGFEARHAERIFTPFQRLHARHAYDGTGIGLSIVRRIAERHGGAVEAESTPGEGSRFTVSLPQIQG